MNAVLFTTMRIWAIVFFAFITMLQNKCHEDKTKTALKSGGNSVTNTNNSRKPFTGSIKLFVPSYFNSGDFTADGKGEWNRLIYSLKADDVMIVNPIDGPGAKPENGFTKAIAAARAKNIVVLGYVYTLQKGKDVPRSVEEIKSDIGKYDSFYEIKDIFFDEFVDTPDVPASTLPFYTEICKFVHDNGGRTTLNPGAVVKEPFAKITDWIVVFESPYDEYKKYDTAHWDWSLKPEHHYKIVHLILGAKKEFMPSVVKKARDANTAYVYVTNYNVGDGEWGKLATYWDDEIVEVRKLKD